MSLLRMKSPFCYESYELARARRVHASEWRTTAILAGILLVGLALLVWEVMQ